MKRLLLVSIFLSILWGASFAAHPLITDDAGTQGKDKSQLEINTEFSRKGEDGSTEDLFEFAAVLSYGVTDSIDVVLGLPYRHIRQEREGQKSAASGTLDASLELKWRVYERAGLSLAFKPGITCLVGDEAKGHISGRVTYSTFFIASKDAGPWAFHLNLGYIRNENRSGERKDLWHTSGAAIVEATKSLSIVANIGIERSADRAASHPAFAMVGGIYGISEDIDFDIGIKVGLSKSETDHAVLAGLAWRF